MTGNRTDLTGEWRGTYTYPAQARPATPFIARIEDRAGALSGTVIEPDTIVSSGTLEANISGNRAGQAVDFTKIYRHPSPEYAIPVDYVGHLSADGAAVTGVWSMLDWDGAFEMFREIATEPQTVETETAA